MYIHFSLEEKKEVMWNFVNSTTDLPDVICVIVSDVHVVCEIIMGQHKYKYTVLTMSTDPPAQH
jgi:hypothetical protein